MKFLDNIKTGKYNLILFSIFLVLIFYLYWTKDKADCFTNTTQAATSWTEDDIKNLIYKTYKLDAAAIQNLAVAANSLSSSNNLTYQGNLIISGNVSGPNDTNLKVNNGININSGVNTGLQLRDTNWSVIPNNNDMTKSYITRDENEGLMIVGNKLASTNTRQVGIWDDLKVTGKLIVAGRDILSELNNCLKNDETVSFRHVKGYKNNEVVTTAIPTGGNPVWVHNWNEDLRSSKEAINWKSIFKLTRDS